MNKVVPRRTCPRCHRSAMIPQVEGAVRCGYCKKKVYNMSIRTRLTTIARLLKQANDETIHTYNETFNLGK